EEYLPAEDLPEEGGLGAIIAVKQTALECSEVITSVLNEVANAYMAEFPEESRRYCQENPELFGKKPRDAAGDGGDDDGGGGGGGNGKGPSGGGNGNGGRPSGGPRHTSLEARLATTGFSHDLVTKNMAYLSSR